MYPARSFSVFAFHVSVTDDVFCSFSVRMTFTVLVILPLVTVMVVELFPLVAVAVLTLTVMVPLLEPDVGLSDSQETLSLALQVPFALMVRVWAAGLAAPCVAV